MTSILHSYDTSFNKTNIFAFMEFTPQGKRQGIKNSYNKYVNYIRI